MGEAVPGEVRCLECNALLAGGASSVKTDDGAFCLDCFPAARRLAMGTAYVGLVCLLVFGSWWIDHPARAPVGVDAAAAALLPALAAAAAESRAPRLQRTARSA